MSKIDDIKNQTFSVDEHGNITNVHKQLLPLEALSELFDTAYNKVRSGWEDKPLERKLFVLNEIIETALKDGEKYKEYWNRTGYQVLEDDKKLKALEIIKTTWKLSFYDEEQMITIDNCYSITFHNKEKYDLLKEVLK